MFHASRDVFTGSLPDPFRSYGRSKFGLHGTSRTNYDWGQ